LSCVVDDGKLGLRERIVRPAVVQVDTARDKLASTSKFLAVIEELRPEVALETVLAESWIRKGGN
jgi:hypothetical protein